MSLETLAHCLDDRSEDRIQLSINYIYERLEHGQIDPDEAEIRLTELREDLAFVYRAIGATKKPYRQAA